jgi:hypothetical protein
VPIISAFRKLRQEYHELELHNEMMSQKTNNKNDLGASTQTGN